MIQADLPTIVDFWAVLCAPCKMIAPFLDEAATEYADKLSVVKLNVDESPNVAAKFGIRSIPTVAIFRNGREVARQAGAMDARTLTNWIRSNI